jgi:DNA-binding NarL/FixJ family response regulator
MTKVLMLINNDLLSLGVISCLQNQDTEATFHKENNWESIQNTLQQTTFDLLIIDSYKVDSFSMNTLNKIRKMYPRLKTMLLGEEDHKSNTTTYLKKGFDGVCMKSISRKNFLIAYTTIMNGKKYLDESLTEYLLAGLENGNSKPQLSPREAQIANLLVHGMRTVTIADNLNLASSTVSTIKFNIYKKMNVQNIVDLALKLEKVRDQVQSI